VLFGIDPLQPKDCIAGSPFKGSSGYRKISLSECIDGQDLSKPIDRICGGQAGQVQRSHFTPTSAIIDFFYFSSTSTVVLIDAMGKVYQSFDGKLWSPFATEYTATDLYLDPFHNNRAFLITAVRTFVSTSDAGSNWSPTALPNPANPQLTAYIPPLCTHPKQESWMLWTGSKCIDSGGCDEFASESYVSWDSGKTWTEFIQNAIGTLI
jgi:Sortilin, neurotensin receptor 3,